ncbi:MAG TPA: type II toxin-antitoxin system HicA family toxin [Candidatus Gastranaerophilales bacterium]|nr:type II toxin-antitoxin system HicA family toxin [Candidatus Gastranaerophilales bacterium]
MSKNNKLIKRFLNNPKDFTWEELVKLLEILGYNEIKTGKTSGSRVKFINSVGNIIKTHKPHPQNIVKTYVINEIKEKLNLEE